MSEKRTKASVKVSCPICEEAIVDESDDSIFCDGPCGSWLHRQCAGLSRLAFALATKSTAKFFCPVCHLTKCVSEVEDLKETITSLQNKLDSVMTISSQSASSAVSTISSQSASSTVSTPTESQPPCQPTIIVSATNDNPVLNANNAKPKVATHLDSVTHRNLNVVIFGLAECHRGTQRYQRIRNDLEAAGDLLSFLDPLVTTQLISDCNGGASW